MVKKRYFMENTDAKNKMVLNEAKGIAPSMIKKGKEEIEKSLTEYMKTNGHAYRDF